MTAGHEDRVWLPATDPAHVGKVRRMSHDLGVEACLPPAAINDLAIVATELATNLIRHADDGMVLLRLLHLGGTSGVQLVATDRGPGFEDFAASSVDGHSTAGTLGIGLGAIARKTTDLDVYSRIGQGTVLAATLWSGTPAPSWSAGIRRAIAGEQMCGDSYAAREIDGRRQIMLCDGLGHGPLAAAAADAATAAFLAAPAGSPRAVLEHMHTKMAHTRGAVAGVAELNSDTGKARFAGIGNITATVLGSSRRAMVSVPGILGQRVTIREFEYPWEPGSVAVLHSDGLSPKWDIADYPGLITRVPVVIAATLLRDAAKRHDDAAVLVARA